MPDVNLRLGDCLEVMAGMEPGSIDAVVTDPPYGLAFMGKDWDHGIPGVHFWQEAIRLLLPSHYLLAFGGTRTWHRLACAIEDAGFEIRDTLMWLYGSGFPKGKSCLKPAWEPIILARKPGPMRELGIDECRIGTTRDVPASVSTNKTPYGFGLASVGTLADRDPNIGRWPANLILSDDAPAMLDEQSGERVAGVAVRHRSGGNTFGTDTPKPPLDDITYGDSGGASRFFYCPKASRAERNEGCEGLPLMEPPASARSNPAPGRELPLGKPRQNGHPTVKPVDLMRWLVRLVASPGETVLDPFMGSGTTGVACALEGREFIGIEKEPEYLEIARARIEAASRQGRLL